MTGRVVLQNPHSSVQIRPSPLGREFRKDLALVQVFSFGSLSPATASVIASKPPQMKSDGRHRSAGPVFEALSLATVAMLASKPPRTKSDGRLRDAGSALKALSPATTSWTASKPPRSRTWADTQTPAAQLSTFSVKCSLRTPSNLPRCAGEILIRTEAAAFTIL